MNLITGSGQSEIEYQDLVLYDGVTYGQSFYAKHNGLQSFNIFIQPDKEGDGNIIVRLRSNISDNSNLELIQINRNSIKNAGYYNFQFSAPYKSYLKGFFVLIDYDGSGSVILGSADQSSYDDGAGYFNGASFPRQLVFSLSYAPIPMILALLKLFFTKWIFWIILSILLYILPGYALLTILKIQFQHTSSMEKVVFSIGISLAITPILFLWTNLIGLNLGLFYAFGPTILSLFYFVFIFIMKKRKINFSLDRFSLKAIDIADVIFLLLIGLLIFSRFWIIRALPLPLWGDLYQHTLITQLLFENKGLFQSWAPYADIPNFTYHFGFHSNAVNFQWLSKENAAQAVMIFGQIINIFAVIVLYPLAVYISPKKSKWAGVIAVFIGGFLLNMPNFYTNWGRYTQLIGQVILIPLVLFIWKILDEEKVAWNNIILAAIMLTGLALSHYRILIIFVLFVPVILFII